MPLAEKVAMGGWFSSSSPVAFFDSWLVPLLPRSHWRPEWLSVERRGFVENRRADRDTIHGEKQMARRRGNDTFGMLLDIVSWLPWPVGVGMGVFVFVYMRFILPHQLAADQAGQMFRGILCASPVPWFLGGLFVAVAIFSALKRAEKRQLFGVQKSLANIRNLSWRDFETYIGEAFRQQGYEVEETGGGGADGGIDLILRNEHETVLVQCKQWRNERVKVNIVREMYGLVHAEGADRGIIVTSGDFTPDARDFASDKPIELLNGRRLEQMVFGAKNSLASAPQSTLRTVPTQTVGIPNRQARPVAASTAPTTANVPPPATKTVPAEFATPACPICKAPMKLRTAKQGPSAGNQFYGCSRYPQCRGIVQVAQ
jgi:restriction system protein